MNHFLLLPFGLLLLAASLACGWLGREIHAEMERPARFGRSIDYTVQVGMHLEGIAQDLHVLGLVRHPRFLVWYARWKDLEGVLQAGEYRFFDKTTPADVLSRMVRGEVVMHSLTLQESWNFHRMLQAVHDHPRLIPSLAEASPLKIMEAIGAPGRSPEGLFFPDTYHFPTGILDTTVLRMAYDKMQRVLKEEWEGRGPELPYRLPYEALTMASIVEREAQIDSERRRIAGVFVRRLQRGIPLQADPTVLYALELANGGVFRGRLTRKALRETNSPYNTYLNSGLPPTPIALASRASIHAALHPEQDDALYFVARGDGSHHFSTTLDEHNDAVARYRSRRRAASKEEAE